MTDRNDKKEHNPYREVHHEQPDSDELLTDPDGETRVPSPRPDGEAES